MYLNRTTNLELAYLMHISSYFLIRGCNGTFCVSQLSILLLEYYEPPILACALNEVLASIVGEESSNIPTLVVPFIVEASKLKLENKNSSTSSEVSLYGLEFGSVKNAPQAWASKIQNPPKSLQIYDEQLSCLLHIVRALDIPVFVLIGQHARHISRDTLKEDLEVHFLVQLAAIRHTYY